MRRKTSKPEQYSKSIVSENPNGKNEGKKKSIGHGQKPRQEMKSIDEWVYDD